MLPVTSFVVPLKSCHLSNIMSIIAWKCEGVDNQAVNWQPCHRLGSEEEHPDTSDYYEEATADRGESLQASVVMVPFQPNPCRRGTRRREMKRNDQNLSESSRKTRLNSIKMLLWKYNKHRRIMDDGLVQHNRGDLLYFPVRWWLKSSKNTSGVKWRFYRQTWFMFDFHET